MLKRLLTSTAARPFLLVVILLLLWDAVIRVFKIPPYLIPPPQKVVGQLIAEWPMLLKQSWLTTLATLGGFALSVLIGIPLAMTIAYSRTVESFVYPLLVFSQSIPKVAIAPLFVVWFGFGLVPKVIAAFLLGFFPVVVATVQGFKSVEGDVIDLARSMGANPFKIFLKFRLPHALPAIFSGLKVSVTLAVVGAVVGEFVNADKGLGYLIVTSTAFFQVPLAWGALVLLSLLGIVLFQAVVIVEQVFFPWAIADDKQVA